MSQRFELHLGRVADVLRAQDGMIARFQLVQLGAAPHDLARLVRRRELRRALPGVFANHTGPLTRRQREWSAVLTSWPAALAGTSALPSESPGGVEVAIAHGRKLVPPPGVTLRRVVDLDDRVQWNRSPPVVRIEHALVDAMGDALAAGDVPEAFALLTRAIGTRRTAPGRVLEAVQSRARLPHRGVITQMISDSRDGLCSVLERGYRDRVERPHGLPRARRQQPSAATGRRTEQDARYLVHQLIIELDGFAFHSSAAARDADALRDLAELATVRAPTVRLTYGLVFTHPCRTARWLAQVLQHRGWTGEPRSCPGCT